MALYLGTYSEPKGLGVSYERGTPVAIRGYLHGGLLSFQDPWDLGSRQVCPRKRLRVNLPWGKLTSRKTPVALPGHVCLAVGVIHAADYRGTSRIKKRPPP